ncbi:unnamed protein product [Camellia sinensis]
MVSKCIAQSRVALGVHPFVKLLIKCLRDAALLGLKRSQACQPFLFVYFCLCYLKNLVYVWKLRKMFKFVVIASMYEV